MSNSDKVVIVGSHPTKIIYSCGCTWTVFYRSEDDFVEYAYREGVPAELCKKHFNIIKSKYLKTFSSV